MAYFARPIQGLRRAAVTLGCWRYDRRSVGTTPCKRCTTKRTHARGQSAKRATVWASINVIFILLWRSSHASSDQRCAMAHQSADRLSLSMALVIGTKPRHIHGAQHAVFGTAPCNALAPHFKARSLHVFAHQSDDVRFAQAELDRNGIERRAVFPGHLDHAVKRGEVNLLGFHSGDDSGKFESGRASGFPPMRLAGWYGRTR